jgi:hypothetical protein
VADIKPITAAGVAAALQKAHRYRLLHDSSAAESICLDVLEVEPENTEAQVMFLLALTDQFPETHGEGLRRAQDAARRLADPYRSAYYSGIVCERWAKAVLQRGQPMAGNMAWEWLDRALGWFARAEAIRPAGNDEAILRWNTCVRMLQSDASIRPRDAEVYEPELE